MELSAMPPMPLDFSVQVRSRAEAPTERNLTPPGTERILAPVSVSDAPATSSAFRVVTPKGRHEGKKQTKL